MPDAQGRPLRADLDYDKGPLLSNSTYDLLNDIVTVVFPAAVVLYVALAGFLGWGDVEKVVGSAGAIIIFLGVLLKVARARFAKVVAAENAAEIPPGGFDGELVVDHSNPEVDNYHVKIDVPWDELGAKNKVTLQVSDNS